MKQELKLQIEVKDIESVNTFIEEVQKYYYDLPRELQATLVRFSEKGISGLGVDGFHSRFGKFEKFETSIETNKIIRLNEALKSVTYVDDFKEITIYPETFWIKLDGKTVIQW